MAKSSEADLSVFVELAAAIPLKQLTARSDLSTTLLEAAASYIGAPGSAATIADALANVLGDRELAQRLSDAGRRRAADFDIETVGPRLLDLYDRAQGGRRI